MDVRPYMYLKRKETDEESQGKMQEGYNVPLINTHLFNYFICYYKYIIYTIAT